jgi:pyruvate/2-oxoglutarate/acetoin dehydrogenase E1 component
MNWLSEKKNTIFLGQSVIFSGHIISSTLTDISDDKKIELPVFEETQLGISTGLALNGFVPITCYPRFDFFILSLNQLVNHLDKMEHMSGGLFLPKVIIRVVVGSKIPIDAGPQHTQNHTDAIKKMLTNINVVELNSNSNIFEEYTHAYNREDGKSTLFVEYGDLY